MAPYLKQYCLPLEMEMQASPATVGLPFFPMVASHHFIEYQCFLKHWLLIIL